MADGREGGWRRWWMVPMADGADGGCQGTRDMAWHRSRAGQTERKRHFKFQILRETNLKYINGMEVLEGKAATGNVASTSTSYGGQQNQGHLAN